MKEETTRSSVLGWIDGAVLIGSAAVALVYAIVKTPPSFWVSAWLIQAVAFAVVVVKRRDDSHWPSTIFGVIEVAYVFALLAILSSSGVSFDGLAQMFFGLLFVHGILYLIAAKSYSMRRGFSKARKT